MSDIGNKSVCLGREHDQSLREALNTVLKELGGVVRGKQVGVAGSQEVESLNVTIVCDGVQDDLVVEAETYVGVTITGRAAVVDRINHLVRARQSKDPDRG